MRRTASKRLRSQRVRVRAVCPRRVVTAATTAVTTAGLAAYAIADIYALQAALPPRFRLNAKSLAVVMNIAIINKTRQFDTAGGSSYWTNLGADQPERVINMPIRESTTIGRHDHEPLQDRSRW